MTVVVGGSSPQITFADSTVQNTAFTGLNQSATPFTTSLGYQVLTGNSGTSNTAIGYQAGYDNTTGANNTFLGYQTAFTVTSGSNNTYLGSGAGPGISLSTGGNNTAVGYQALLYNTTASSNTAVGYQAGYTNSTGGSFVAVGYRAGYTYNGSETNGSVFVGYSAGLNVTSGHDNCFVGGYSGNAVTTGSNNTILGAYSGNQGGLDIRTASNYIVLSDGAGNVRGYFDNSGIFNVGQTVNGITNSNGFTLNVSSGSMSQNHVSGTSSGAYYSIFGYNGSIIGSITQSGTTAVLYNVTSDQRLKENIVDAPDASNDIDAIKVRSFDFISDKSPVKYGFIAQELVTVAPDAVHQPSNPDDMMGVDYSKLVPMMLKEIQSLRARLKAANIA